MKILEKFKIKTVDGGEYILIATGVLADSTRVGFITSQELNSVRCSWTDPVSEGQKLTLMLVNSDGERSRLTIPTIVQLKTRRAIFGWPRWGSRWGKRLQ